MAISGYMPELIISGNCVFVSDCSNAQSRHLKQTAEEAQSFALLVLDEFLKMKTGNFIPKSGNGYWIPCFNFSTGAKYLWSWSGEERELEFLNLGLVFQNEKDASEAFHKAVEAVKKGGI